MNRHDREREQDQQQRADEHAALLEVLTKGFDRLDAKVDEVHDLADGNLSASMRSELAATVRDIASMREIMALKDEQGHPPSKETLQVIEAAEERANDLRNVIDRQAAAEE